MAPLFVLVPGFVILRLLGLVGVTPLDGWQPALRVALALMFLLTASAHFLGQRKTDLIEMVPPRVPAPGVLVALTGVLELAGAVGLLVPATTSAAASCLTLLMLVMLPANISAARRNLTLNGKPVMGVWPRVGLQVVFVAAAVAVI
ncbi:DoxX family protein [Amycolatopsis sp.]|uniref:DoxX family protein n=1 Tax=Amycolatopsis sp. TaxID=37632 RepID=UPI002BD5FB92|nr:DoxX family membrane protein [Amycolatopsis sp.]HVV11724.1 DoxX family membrane protein [Amycolatopsis sp.]